MTSVTTEIITLKWLAEKNACALERRIADLSAYLGRKAVPEDGLSIEDWAALLRADGYGPSATLLDLSWVMRQIDPVRWRRAFAAVLEMVLGAGADPRSLKIVEMLRSGASEEEWHVAVRAAADAVVVLDAQPDLSASGPRDPPGDDCVHHVSQVQVARR